MFGTTSKTSTQISDTLAAGNGREPGTGSADGDLGGLGTTAPAPSSAKGLAKSRSVLENVDGDGLVLIGRNTQLVGEITNCSQVEIQGALEGTVVADTVIVREGGTIKGQLRTTNADVHGIVEGEVVVDGLLDVKSTGQVTGDITYGQFSVEVGGVVAGQFSGRSPAERSDYQPSSQAVDISSSEGTPNGGIFEGSQTPQ